MKAIINSLHSDSIPFIGEYRPEMIISLDAHPDLGHWNNVETVRSILKLRIPQKMKSSFFRTSIQTLLTVLIPRSEILSVVPEACVITEYNWNFFLKAFAGIKSKRRRFTKQVAISDWRRKLAKLSIKGYMSPPDNLEPLLHLIGNKSLAVDIDADYIFELTRSCNTPAGFSDTPIPITGMPQDNLGSIIEVLNFLSLSKPMLVTISELSYQAIKSNDIFHNFCNSLKKMGYNIEEGVLYSEEDFRDVMRIKANFDSFTMKNAESKSSNDFYKSYIAFLKNIGINFTGENV